MANQNPLPQMGKDALDLWCAGELEAAADLYQKILALAEPDYVDLPHFHSSYAGVLAALGQLTRAQEHYELALIAQLEEDKSEFTPGVIIARYFLAEHLLQLNEPLRALQTVLPSMPPEGSSQYLLTYIQAQAYAQLGSADDARSHAQRCLAQVPSEQKYQQLKELFTHKNIL